MRLGYVTVSIEHALTDQLDFDCLCFVEEKWNGTAAVVFALMNETPASGYLFPPDKRDVVSHIRVAII